MDLEAEVRDLAARRDIHDAICNYMRGQDRLMPEVQRLAFHDDARYIDRYENRGGGWKIAKRRELIDWARTDPATDSFLKGQTSLVLGARGAADFSNVRTWP